MAAITTREQIANLALRHIGDGTTITNLATDTTEQGILLNQLYDVALEDVTRDFDFPHTTVIEDLVLVKADPNDEWGWSYRYPATAKNVRRILWAVRRDTAQSRIPFKIIKDDVKSIAAITQANPASVTSTAHGYATGDQLYISSVGGMTQITDGLYIITKVSADVYTLNGVNSAAYGAYTSGGKSQGGNLILTGVEDAQAEYSQFVDRPFLYPPDFALALSYRLAAYAAPKLSKSGDLTQLVMRLYEMSKSKAEANAANENKLDEPNDAEWIRGR